MIEITKIIEDMKCKLADIEARVHFYDDAKRAADNAAREMYKCFLASANKHAAEAVERSNKRLAEIETISK